MPLFVERGLALFGPRSPPRPGRSKFPVMLISSAKGPAFMLVPYTLVSGWRRRGRAYWRASSWLEPSARRQGATEHSGQICLIERLQKTNSCVCLECTRPGDLVPQRSNENHGSFVVPLPQFRCSSGPDTPSIATSTIGPAVWSTWADAGNSSRRGK